MGNHQAAGHEITVARLILKGLILVMALFGVCVLIRPHGLVADHGLSYYGGYWNTLPPYALALLTSCLIYWNSADRIATTFSRHKKLFSFSLRIMALLCVGLLITPHSRLHPFHVAFGATLFALQLIIALVLVYANRYERRLVLLTLVQFCSGLAAMYYLPSKTGWLLESQIIYQLAFGFLLYRALMLSSFHPTHTVPPDR